MHMKTDNVVVVMVDGLRWQEVFTGAEVARVEQSSEPLDPGILAPTPEERRAALMPFFWGSIAQHGALIGNRPLGSESDVANPSWFSYPGYSETLCGLIDPEVTANEHGPNPRVTVFEWLAQQPEWRGELAVFGAWDVIGDVFNRERVPFTVSAGWNPLPGHDGNEAIRLLNTLKAELPRQWTEEPYDAITFRTAMEYLRETHPRALFLGLGEPDEWAHAGEYRLYLDAIHRFDAYVAELWSTLQALDQYRDRTTLILTCDHGRGFGDDWIEHWSNIPGSGATWMGFLGPDTPALGERVAGSLVNGQIAPTIAAFLGYDFPAEFDPIAAVLPTAD